MQLDKTINLVNVKTFLGHKAEASVIPSNTTITQINGTVVTLSNNLTAELTTGSGVSFWCY